MVIDNIHNEIYLSVIVIIIASNNLSNILGSYLSHYLQNFYKRCSLGHKENCNHGDETESREKKNLIQ